MSRNKEAGAKVPYKIPATRNARAQQYTVCVHHWTSRGPSQALHACSTRANSAPRRALSSSVYLQRLCHVANPPWRTQRKGHTDNGLR